MVTLREPQDTLGRGGWTVEKQATVVLRLLQGEPIDAVSAETGVPLEVLDGWRRVFLAAGASALRSYERRLLKEMDAERRRQEAEPARSDFAAVPNADPAAVNLPVPEHLHYLWVTLGLDAD
jgi:hypothetical protein